MKKTIGFIGAGNMGKAIMKGLLSAQLTTPEQIVVYDAYEPILAPLHDELGIRVATSNQDVAQQADMIILAVKPNMITAVLSEMKQAISTEKVLISIAAGVTLASIEGALMEQTKVVRVMPNTPALVNAGMSSLSPNTFVTEEEQADVVALFKSFGKAQIVPEYLIDAVVGVSGSAPAYVYMFIEALADGAVLAGLTRAQAYEFAAQTVYGSAKMVLETGQHPGALKDMVCSPGGTTIAAVHALEEGNFRGTVMNAVLAAAKKNQELS